MIWAALILAYLIGAIPTGYIVARRVAGIDIREHGSGNVGATNVGRVVGKKAGLAVLILDFFKGLLPVLAAVQIFGEDTFVPVAVAILVLVGHSRSVFIGFSGGKAAISGLGTILALSPVGGLILGVLAYTVIKLSRIVSVGSMTTAVATPLTLWLLGEPLPTVLYGVAAAVLVIVLHRANIVRLFKGQENRLT
jgi:glycerol-3-phosphate acyltransferase PlsY